MPFVHDARCLLERLYGPAAARQITRRGVEACGQDRASFTLEIHESPGRLPIDDAAELAATGKTLCS